MDSLPATETALPDGDAGDRADDYEALLEASYGNRDETGWRSYAEGEQTDKLFDLANMLNPRFWRIARRAASAPVRRVHVVAVDVPARRDDLQGVFRALRDSRHQVTTSLAPLGDRGKFQNINIGLADVDLSGVDWLIVVDDDVAFPTHFLDQFIYTCEAAALKIAQPAHRFRSHTTWAITQRYWNSLAHLTHFVECGPLTAFHRDVFDRVLPFPESRWAWGVDVVWAEIARRDGFRIGVVDATPIEHLRPVAATYDAEAARREARALLDRYRVRRTHREVFATTAVLSRL